MLAWVVDWRGQEELQGDQGRYCNHLGRRIKGPTHSKDTTGMVSGIGTCLIFELAQSMHPEACPQPRTELSLSAQSYLRSACTLPNQPYSTFPAPAPPDCPGCQC